MSIIEKHFKSYIFTGSKETCSGCGACAQICARQALTMHPDEEGFLFPILDADKCVRCGLCDNCCPEVNDWSNKIIDQHCYIATTEHKKYYKDSASIGICTMLADNVVSQGGVVYGACLDESDWSIYHIGVTDKDGVQKIRNSKYLQSDTRDTFREVKAHLINGVMVLYIGTPCQIAGLKSYLRKDYDNLYTIDLICHGVASPKLMPLEIGYWKKVFGDSLCNFRFRSKRVYTLTNGGMVNFDISIEGNTKHIERFAASSPTYHCFAYSGDGKNHNLRLSCYNCPFKAQSRYADITVGDPWFIREQVIKNYPLKSHNTIRSLYSVNTKKGMQLVSKISSLLYQHEYTFDDSFVQPAVTFGSRVVPQTRKEIYSRLDKEDYGKIVESIFHCNLEQEHRNFIKNYRIRRFKYIIKKVIGYYKWKK